MYSWTDSACRGCKRICHKDTKAQRQQELFKKFPKLRGFDSLWQKILFRLRIRDPDWIQTNDPKLRRFVLYSAELPDQLDAKLIFLSLAAKG